MFFRMIFDPNLAQAAYLIGCQRTGEAIIIDPERDIDRYIEIAATEDLRIVAATETHIHADFLSGVREFAEFGGATLYLSDEGDADWRYLWLNDKQSGGSYDHVPLKHGSRFHIGKIRFDVLHTPGHTPEHISFIVTDQGGGADAPMGIATGDFVFVGDVGRPDLLETAAGVVGAKDASARTLFKSLQQFQDLPDYLQVWPGHGAGSACGKALGAVPQSTVGYEKRFNAALQYTDDEARFVSSVLSGQPEPPMYFARMKQDNKGGPPLLGKVPVPHHMSVEQLISAAKDGGAILDTRSWQDFQSAFLPDSLYAPLTTAYAAVAGSYILPETPIYLVTSQANLDEAVRGLVRVGLDRVAGFITPDDLNSYREAGGRMDSVNSMSISDLLTMRLEEDALILDVRRGEEFAEGHLDNAANIAYTRLLTRLKELPAGKKLYVHCRTGLRSSYAVPFLLKNGFDAIQMDGGYLKWQEAGGQAIMETSQVS